MNLGKLLKYIKNPSLLKKRYEYFKLHGRKGKKMDDENYIRLDYFYRFGREIDLENPKTFNEKLQWLKLHDRKPLYTNLSDKLISKEIIKGVLGNKYIVPTLKIYDNAKDIVFEDLPKQFVLKCNHDSGSVIVCKDKDKLNKRKTIKALNKAMKTDYYLNSREWPYKNIERKIFAEQYMKSEDGSSLIDYKFFCFNGEPKFLYVSQDMDNHSIARMAFFDLQGKKLPFGRSDYKPMETMKVPNNFEELKEIASHLAKFSQSKFVRIDLYTINGNIYFSEFTFFPCSGHLPFVPKEADYEIGKLLKIK